ncbi:hypothetical protein GW17_00010068 [Ensete ventricosum]|nr:hypothetical protein GW17_00010068 [Ensete ventricosum]
MHGSNTTSPHSHSQCLQLDTHALMCGGRERRCRLNVLSSTHVSFTFFEANQARAGEYLSSSAAVKATERPPPLASPSLSFNCASSCWVWHQ